MKKTLLNERLFRRLKFFSAFFCTLFVLQNAVAQTFPSPYCTKEFEWSVEAITNVTFGSINQNTPASSSIEVINYTAVSTNVLPASVMPISVNGFTDGAYTNYIYAFIDWNQNGEFDLPEEQYYIGTIYDNTGSGTPATGSITIPYDATLGNTRMRILKVYGSEMPIDISPCDFDDYGQVQDYTVNVEDVDCEFPVYTVTTIPDCDENEFSIDLNISSMGDASSYNLLVDGVLNSAVTDTGSVILGPYTSGTSKILKLVHNIDTVCSVTMLPITYNCPPVNDECENAILIFTSETPACLESVFGTTNLASQSLAGCAGTADDDVWFKFVATNTAHVVTLSSVTAVSGASTDVVFQVFSGSCSAPLSLLCSDPNSGTVLGLTVGNTYFVRVYTYYNTSNVNFHICVTTPPPPPANDECSSAVLLTVNTSIACSVKTSGNTLSATQSLPGCAGSADDDVWFKFTATGPSHLVTISNVVGSSTDMVFQVYDACSSGTSLLCSDPNSGMVNGLTIANTYYVRVYTYGSGQNASFDICISTPITGSLCSNPIDINLLPYITNDSTQKYGNFLKDGTPGTSATCGSSSGYLNGDDVIYEYVADFNGTVNVTVKPTNTYAGVFVYNSCSNIGITCYAGKVNGNNSDTLKITSMNVVEGESYFVVISTWASPQNTPYWMKIEVASVAVDSIVVSVEDDAAAVIDTDGGTLQMITTVYPALADDEVTWSIIGGTGTATISSTGLVTAITNGTVYAKAISVTDASKYDSLLITLTNQIIIPAIIEVIVEDDGEPVIAVDDGTLQMDVIYSPIGAEEGVTWSIITETGTATISTSGLVTALTNGTVWAKAVSLEAATVKDSVQITISNQIIAPSSIDVVVESDGTPEIDTDGGTLQLLVNYLPDFATEGVEWSIVDVGDGEANIDEEGLVTAIGNGIVWAKAISIYDETIIDSIEITITNQITLATGIEVLVADGAAPTITVLAGTLQLESIVMPEEADSSVTWSVVSGTGTATISTNGLVTAISNGTVYGKAISVSNPDLADSLMITISNQEDGIDKVNKYYGFEVYPNPSSSEVYIKLNKEHDNAVIQLIDVNGRVVMSENLSNNDLLKPHRIHLSEYAAGIYLIQINIKEEKMIKKIVKH